MRDAIVFAGTREGRQLYEYCEENGINALFCVATAYGSDTLDRLCKLNIRAGRMTADQMLSLFLEENPGLVIDATHPYATEATAQIRDAVRRYRQAEGITEEIYCRVLRQVAQEDMPPDEAFDSLERAVEYLDGTDGKILAVTGSKGVKILCKLKDFQNRVYLRILPNPDILRECLAAGFPADHMLCMQGPFTEEMNRATLTQYGISYLLTKMSGEAGGYPEKYRAARAAGVKIAAVLPPQETDGISPEEAIRLLSGPKKSQDQRRLYIVGVGMGNPRSLTVEAKEVIESAQLLIGASRMTAPYRDGKRCIDTYKTEEILRILTDELAREDGSKITAVLVSGDSGFYSGTRKLLAALEENQGLKAPDGDDRPVKLQGSGHELSEASAYNVTVLPGVSSLSYFCAKIGVPWENVKIVNLHGARENLWQAVFTHEKVFAITGGSGGVSEVLTELVRMGFASLTAYVGERLSYEDERIRKGTVQELLKGADDCDELAVLYLENPRAVGSPLTGLPDTAFVRGDAAHGNQTPMTKSEVRAVVMSRLRLRETDIVYDIGAGTGSVSVEMALAASKGTVYAVECDPKAVELCKLNKEKFGLHNFKIVEGTAPDILRNLPAPDAAFIGGSRGQLRDIIACLVKKNPAVRLVVNTVTTENTSRALALLENEAFTGAEAVQLQVSRIQKTGAGHMVTAQNPITILSARGAARPGAPAEKPQTNRGVLIAGTGSGSGKTTLVCGLLRILKEKGYAPCAFKCGPDYIDPSFHNKITGVFCYNLDPFFTDAETMRMLYARHSSGYDISVIEGVMGYYDGIGFTGEASTYSVAKALDVPVILTVDAKGMGHSVLAALEGYLHHREPSYIAGVIFNRMAPALYEQAADAARSLGIRPLGYLPDLGDASLAGRHLGLVMADEVDGFETVIGRIAEAVAQTVDVDAVMRIADAGCRGDMACVGTECDNGNTPLCRIAVARDEAFCFLYEDNLHFLREHGALIVPFSPLHDKMLPECDALYLSGGYPELYAAGLEENASMREDIRTKIEDGMPCIAECGGFLYLHDRLEACAEEGAGERPENGKTFYKMTGVIKSDAVNGRRKGRFGYIEATLAQDCLLGRQGETFRAHEFHYWESQAEGCGLQIYKPGSGAAWQEGICTDTLYAGFPHLYFYGSPKTGENYIRAAAAYAAGRNVR